MKWASYFLISLAPFASLPVPGKGAATQKSLQAKQRTAVILIRGLLDQWHLFRAEDLPIQALFARLNSLAIGHPTILTTAGECCNHLAGTAQGADFPASHGEPHTSAILVST